MTRLTAVEAARIILFAGGADAKDLNLRGQKGREVRAQAHSYKAAREWVEWAKNHPKQRSRSIKAILRHGALLAHLASVKVESAGKGLARSPKLAAQIADVTAAAAVEAQALTPFRATFTRKPTADHDLIAQLVSRLHRTLERANYPVYADELRRLDAKYRPGGHKP